MSYVKPSVLVYQELINGGGVLNSTPDLEACIIGPCYQVLKYVAGSIPSQVKTAAHSTSTTTGTMTLGSYDLTVVSTGGFSSGDSVLVVGAGASGANLQANVVSISGNILTLDAAAATAVTAAVITKAGKISNSTINNTFGLPGVLPGQVIDSASITPWLNNAKVETLVTSVEGSFNNSILSVLTITAATSGTTNALATSVVLADSKGLVKGDSITIAGAGTAGGVLTTKIALVAGNTLTISPATVTQVLTGAVVTKVAPVNLNSTTNTLRVEAGDTIVATYTDTSSVVRTQTSQVKTVVTSSGNNGTLTTITMNDMFPSNVSYSTIGTVSGGTLFTGTGGTNGISISNYPVGSKVIVRGGGAAGADLITTVASVNTTVSLVLTDAAVNLTGLVLIRYNNMSLSVRKTYNNQQLAVTQPISLGTNFSTTDAGTLGQVTINANCEVIYGPVITAEVFFGYKALRTDLINRVLTINDVNDLIGQLGDISDENPLALGVQLALANTTGRIRAITVPSNDLAGYQNAMEAAEGERLYYLTPLTQDVSILAAFKAHVVQMSTPENASWRVAIVNSAIPTTQNIGTYSSSFVNANSGNSNVAVVAGKYVLTASNATFISDGVAPGDMINISASTPSTIVGAHQILEVVSNQQLVISAVATGTAVSYYISRTMSKTQSAAAVKATSETFLSSRVWHIQPDTVGVTVDGVVKYLPGYYLCCGLAGMGAGFPVQQGFTNIGVAGIADLKNSNFYFSKANLNTMAEGGTCLFVQENQSGIPYCRHAMTTDVSVLEYREQMAVKDWDFLSYFYFDKLKMFIGVWNITPDTINTIRQTIIASSELLKGKKLPKIGAPLLGYNITSIAQNLYNKDNLDVVLGIQIPYSLNYLNLYLQI